MVVLVIAGVAGLIALLAYGVVSESDDEEVTGESAPEFSLPPLEGGEEKSLGDFRGHPSTKPSCVTT